MTARTIGGVMVVGLLALPAAAQAAPCSDARTRGAQHHLPANGASGANGANENEGGVATDGDDHVATMSDDCIERDIFFMPGVFGVFFAPRAAAAPFTGAGVQIAPFQWSHNNDRFGPSQGSFTLGAALLQSPRSGGTLALFEMGATASLERNASRRWLIPYFGATVGGMSQSELGTSGYAYPLAGLHLYWHRNLMLDAEGGYHFPFQDIDQTRGPRAQLSARFSLW